METGDCDAGQICVEGVCTEPGDTDGADTSASGADGSGPDSGGSATDGDGGGSDGTASSGTGVDDTSGGSATTDGSATGPTSSASTTGASTTGSTDGGSASTSTTGGGPCPNGLPDPGEECDDGDMINGNGCNNDCTVSGQEIWTQTYNSLENLDEDLYGVAADGDNNIVVVGFTNATGQDKNILVVKYHPDSSLFWERTVDGGNDTEDWGRGVAVDGNDDIVVVAWVTTATQSYDVWLRKYLANGQTDWTETYHNVDRDIGLGVTTDASDDALAVGASRASGNGDENVFVRKYASNGTPGWVDLIEFSLENDAAYGAAADSDGNFFVVGSWDTEPRYGSDIFVRKYDGLGNESWTETYDGAGTNTEGDVARDVATDPAGNAYVCGTTKEPGNSFWLRKYDGGGNDLWTKSGAGECLGVEVDGDGHVVMAGSFLRKYNADGVLFWTRTITDLRDVAVDTDDNVIVVSLVSVGGEGTNGWIRKYSP